MANALHGVIVIDKPLGPTSHDVVAKLRKTLGTRAIGHAGTLDPAASGVLVVAVGEATKLVAYLTADQKEYRATVTFGSATTTLDAEGDVVATAPVPESLTAELCAIEAAPKAELADPTRFADPTPLDETSLLRRALAVEKARTQQIPPAYSAIKTGGRSAHELARRGEEVELAARPIAIARIGVTGATATSIELVLLVSKGFYVRSFARDLGATLGVPAHLSALRRTASGGFTLGDALPWTSARAEIESRMLTVESAAVRVLPPCTLSEEGVMRARHGKRLLAEHFESPPGDAVSAWLAPDGTLVALGKPSEEGGFAVERGFGHATSTSST